MKPRLISTPRLSVRERTLLLALLVFTPERAHALLGRLAGPRAEVLRQDLDEVSQVDARLLALELRRLFDSRFEGIERIHPSWLLEPLEKESPGVRAAWNAQLPPALRAGGTRRATAAAMGVLRGILARGLVEMSPEPRGARLRRRHLAELPQSILEALCLVPGPEALGKALSDLGEDLARRVAQRLERKNGEALLEGWRRGGGADEMTALKKALKQHGLTLEDGV